MIKARRRRVCRGDALWTDLGGETKCRPEASRENTEPPTEPEISANRLSREINAILDPPANLRFWLKNKDVTVFDLNGPFHKTGYSMVESVLSLRTV